MRLCDIGAFAGESEEPRSNGREGDPGRMHLETEGSPDRGGTRPPADRSISRDDRRRSDAEYRSPLKLKTRVRTITMFIQPFSPFRWSEGDPARGHRSLRSASHRAHCRHFRVDSLPAAAPVGASPQTRNLPRPVCPSHNPHAARHLEKGRGTGPFRAAIISSDPLI